MSITYELNIRPHEVDGARRVVNSWTGTLRVMSDTGSDLVEYIQLPIFDTKEELTAEARRKIREREDALARIQWVNSLKETVPLES